MMDQEKASTRKYFPVIVEKLPNGYWAMCPIISNCFTNGLTYEETLINMQDTIVKELKKLRAKGEEPRPATAFSFTVMEVQE